MQFVRGWAEEKADQGLEGDSKGCCDGCEEEANRGLEGDSERLCKG